jgi:predicted nucleic acid-binding Zn finger protein
MPGPNVTTISINTRDARDMKALLYFEEALSWAKCRVRIDGRIVKAYGLRSITNPSQYWLANLRQCSCPDFQFRQNGRDFKCCHMRAVRWFVDYLKMEERKEGARAAVEAARASSEKPVLVDAF